MRSSCKKKKCENLKSYMHFQNHQVTLKAGETSILKLQMKKTADFLNKGQIKGKQLQNERFLKTKKKRAKNLQIVTKHRYQIVSYKSTSY